jgi:hypothetical protein
MMMSEVENILLLLFLFNVVFLLKVSSCFHSFTAAVYFLLSKIFLFSIEN